MRLWATGRQRVQFEHLLYWNQPTISDEKVLNIRGREKLQKCVVVCLAHGKTGTISTFASD